MHRFGPMRQVLDLGAGTGIASTAFAEAGADQVFALEPDESDVVGLGCLRTLIGSRPISALCSFGDSIPLASASIDLVYCRQVLHHIEDLPRTMAECARVLRPGGLFLAVREHVVDDDLQLVNSWPSTRPSARRGRGRPLVGDLPGSDRGGWPRSGR